MKKFALFLAVIFTGFLWSTNPANAYETPSFPLCSNPQGTLKVSYETGTHGIVGSEKTYSGQDSVYYVSNENLFQCFCAEDGSGIQTDWWRLGDLTREEIDDLLANGWIIVEDGSLWGLSQVPYVARNSYYTCKATEKKREFQIGGPPVCTANKPDDPTIISVQRSGTKAVLAWTKVEKATHYVIAYGETPGNYIYGVPNTGNQTSYTIESLDPNKKYYFVVYAVNDCMPSDPSSEEPRGYVQGLALTGGIYLIYSSLASALFFLGASKTLRKLQEKA